MIEVTSNTWIESPWIASGLIKPSMSPIYHKASKNALFSFGVGKAENATGVWANLGWDTGGLAKNGLTLGLAFSDREGLDSFRTDMPLISMGAYEILGVFPPTVKGKIQFFLSGAMTMTYSNTAKQYISGIDVTVDSSIDNYYYDEYGRFAATVEPERINVSFGSVSNSLFAYGFTGGIGVLRQVKLSAGPLFTFLMGVQWSRATVKVFERELRAIRKDNVWQIGVMSDLSPRFSMSGSIASAFDETNPIFSIGLTYYLQSESGRKKLKLLERTQKQ